MNHPLLGVKTPTEGSGSHAWQLDFNNRSLTYLTDHAFQGVSVVPGAAYVEVGLAGLITLMGNIPYRLSDISFDQVLLINENKSNPTRLVLSEEENATWKGKILSSSSTNASEQTHVTFQIQADHSPKSPSQTLSVEDIRESCTQEYSGHTIYERFKANKNEYGPAFQSIANLYVNQTECLASLRLHSLVESMMYHYHFHPAILDACVQSLACIDYNNTSTYVLSAIQELQIYQFPSKVGWIHARVIEDRNPQGLIGEIDLYDTDRTLVLSMKGIELKYLPKENQKTEKQAEKNHIVVAATFTADPVEASLSYWMDRFNTPATVSFSPYNQVFQELLNPNSLLSSHANGINIIMLRLHDWANQLSLSSKANDSDLARLLSQREHYTLPNKLQIAHLNKYETQYLYKEIFEDQTYLKHNIEIPADGCVIDVGANIGMFTLFVLSHAPEAKIYSFEPSPPAFEALATNAALYGKHVIPYNVGLSDHNGEATFTFYNNSSVFSSFHADQDLDKVAIQTVVENVLIQTQMDQASVDTFSEELMEHRLDKQTFPCQLRTLSAIIEEEEIESIDLLKVDVEKSELHVLRGIKTEHWQRIKQIVIEVHDTQGDVIKEVSHILEQQGFEIVVEEEELLKESGLFNVYGKRTDHTQPVHATSGNQTRTALEKNIKDLVDGLALKQKRNNTPCIVVSCPENPEIYDNPQLSSIYSLAEESLEDQLKSIPNTFLLSHKEIFNNYPVKQYFDPASQAIGDVPYTPAFFSVLGTSIARKIQSIYRKPYKVIVLDCDNTLWQGVVGDAGAHGIELTPGHKALQSFILQQHDAGMLLCLCSKNAEQDVMAVFDQNLEMVLKTEHIVTSRINWDPKSENIASLAEELDLGLDSFIFLDDNPVECAEVKARLPEVLTLQVPTNPQHLESFLNHIWAFDHLTTTSEDRIRTRLYQQNLQRNAYQKNALSFASFIEGLQLEIEITEPLDNHIPRFSQLTQRTNQFNMTTRRRTEAEINAWVKEEDNHGLVVAVKDRFGDYGLVGAILYSLDTTALLVDSFILSCRVLGKGVEHAMLRHIGTIAKENGRSEVHIPFTRTHKNLPALRFLLEAVHTPEQEEAISNRTFVLPTEQACTYTFDPEDADSGVERATTSTKQAVPNQNNSSAEIEQIAHTLNNADDIHKAVQAHILRARPSQKTAFIAPGKKLEQSIALIWQEVLGINQIGINDNFFEIGGTSLKAVQVVSKLRDELDADVSLVTMFEKPNIKALAILLNTNSTAEESPTPSASKQRGEMRRANRMRRGRQRNN